jgi:hypothetical protein
MRPEILRREGRERRRKLLAKGARVRVGRLFIYPLIHSSSALSTPLSASQTSLLTSFESPPIPGPRAKEGALSSLSFWRSFICISRIELRSTLYYTFIYIFDEAFRRSLAHPLGTHATAVAATAPLQKQSQKSTFHAGVDMPQLAMS